MSREHELQLLSLLLKELDLLLQVGSLLLENVGLVLKAVRLIHASFAATSGGLLIALPT